MFIYDELKQCGCFGWSPLPSSEKSCRISLFSLLYLLIRSCPIKVTLTSNLGPYCYLVIHCSWTKLLTKVELVVKDKARTMDLPSPRGLSTIGIGVDAELARLINLTNDHYSSINIQHGHHQHGVKAGANWQWHFIRGPIRWEGATTSSISPTKLWYNFRLANFFATFCGMVLCHLLLGKLWDKEYGAMYDYLANTCPSGGRGSQCGVHMEKKPFKPWRIECRHKMLGKRIMKWSYWICCHPVQSKVDIIAEKIWLNTEDGFPWRRGVGAIKYMDPWYVFCCYCQHHWSRHPQGRGSFYWSCPSQIKRYYMCS